MASTNELHPRVLVMQSASAECGPISGVLESDGFDVEVVTDCSQAVERARTASPDVVVLDLRANPGAKAACTQLRSFSDAYVLVVTSNGMKGCDGLECGADDFLTPDASGREVSSRARAMLRRPRAGTGAGAPLVCGPISLDHAAREVVVDGVEVPLTRIEYDILHSLVSEPRTVVTRRALIERVWGPGWFGDEHVVDVHVSNLRRKVERGGAVRVLTTVRGVGYRADPPA